MANRAVWVTPFGDEGWGRRYPMYHGYPAYYYEARMPDRGYEQTLEERIRTLEGELREMKGESTERTRTAPTRPLAERIGTTSAVAEEQPTAQPNTNPPPTLAERLATSDRQSTPESRLWCRSLQVVNREDLEFFNTLIHDQQEQNEQLGLSLSPPVQLFQGEGKATARGAAAMISESAVNRVMAGLKIGETSRAKMDEAATVMLRIRSFPPSMRTDWQKSAMEWWEELPSEARLWRPPQWQKSVGGLETRGREPRLDDSPGHWRWILSSSPQYRPKGVRTTTRGVPSIEDIVAYILLARLSVNPEATTRTEFRRDHDHFMEELAKMIVMTREERQERGHVGARMTDIRDGPRHYQIGTPREIISVYDIDNHLVANGLDTNWMDHGIIQAYARSYLRETARTRGDYDPNIIFLNPFLRPEENPEVVDEGEKIWGIGIEETVPKDGYVGLAREVERASPDRCFLGGRV
jgi:hypothetical protein